MDSAWTREGEWASGRESGEYIAEDADVVLDAPERYVSRAGLKLSSVRSSTMCAKFTRWTWGILRR